MWLGEKWLASYFGMKHCLPQGFSQEPSDQNKETFSSL